jgi:hypothetical protein
MACLAITGAMKLTPTEAMEVLLNLTPLDLLIMAVARMALYRLQIYKQLNVPRIVSSLLTIWNNVGDPLLEMRSDYIIPVYHHTKNFVIKIDQEYWKNKDPVFPEDVLIWFTDGSRADSGTGAGIYGRRPERSFSFSLGKYATIFQTEIYAILQCAYKNIRRAYRYKQMLIFSDSQTALKALSSPKVTSRLVAECMDALSVLANRNETVASQSMIRLTNLLGKVQQRRSSAHSWLLEYLGVQQVTIKN